jgi:hypothetical protein
MNVVAFPDRLILGARRNLDDLVERARSLRVFGPAVDFDAQVWDLVGHFDRKPGKASSSFVLYFTERQEIPSRKVTGRTGLPEDFAKFMKATIVMRRFASRTSFGMHQRTLMVGRVLCEVLARDGRDLAEARPTDFFATATGLREIYSPNSAYSCGEELEAIGRFVDKHHLCKVAIRFSNPIPRPEDAYVWRTVDDGSREERSKKFPDDTYVGAVIDASLAVRAGGMDQDLARLSVLEILLCAPWRINELLGLARACDRREVVGDDGSVKYGLAYEGSKKYPKDVKWFPSRMKPVAERAFDDLVRLTQPSRDVALWMEKHPGRAWLPDPWCLRDRATPITATELAEMMGLSQRGAATLWMNSRGCRGRVIRHQCTYDLGQVEDAIISMVAETMEDVPPGRKLSEYLFLFPHNFFHRSRATFVMAPSFLTQAQMRDFLVGDDAERLENSVGGSIFKRLNILDSKGQPFRIPSHGPRRYLNNMANEGLVSDLDLARWSGRQNVSQNAPYDNTGGAPLGRIVQKAVETERFVGGMARTIRKIRPADRADFLKARFATAHTTDIGMCVSDWSLAPCPSHGACAAGCGDHLLIKGDEKHRSRTETLLAEHEAMLAQVKLGEATGGAGAGPWVEHQQKMVDGLRKALAVHGDVSIADGTIVQP